ncbi:hypothetical protein L1887_31576 [Cichorium endivia]|nr:hypothetical protein L1887_31576 [Cichorium endivia]
MNFNEEDEASFFKILLSDSVDYLPLPTAFAKKYLGKANNKKQTLFVETKPAVKWSVKYVKIEDKYYFMDGWLNFMKDNCLQKGDLLVFWLRSPPNFMFQVFFFAPNGCLKHPISSSGACDGMKLVVKEGESNDDDESDDFLGNVQNCSRRVLRISCLYRMPLTNAFWNTAGIDGPPPSVIKHKDLKGKAKKRTVDAIKNKQSVVHMEEVPRECSSKVERSVKCSFGGERVLYRSTW